mmetsp:Transcript_116125/g.205347  ORF Transcript_116125/g.205347 Transcript_116125/m.205347 type:complete len:249 (+) Transcript_116125:82-828(+)
MVFYQALQNSYTEAASPGCNGHQPPMPWQPLVAGCSQLDSETWAYPPLTSISTGGTYSSLLFAGPLRFGGGAYIKTPSSGLTASRGMAVGNVGDAIPGAGEELLTGLDGAEIDPGLAATALCNGPGVTVTELGKGGDNTVVDRDELSDSLGPGEGDLAFPEVCLITGTYEDVGEETVVTVDAPPGGTYDSFFGDPGCMICCIGIPSGGTNDVCGDAIRGVGTNVAGLEGLLAGVALRLELRGMGVHDD